MIVAWLILGAAVLWALTRLGREFERPGGARWRVTATVFAAAAFAGAGLSLMRGAWLIALVLAAAGVWLALEARRRPVTRAQRAAEMTLAEARDILGVGADAGEAEIQAAWKRLMGRIHPDRGGSAGLAARLNAARDRLLRG